MAVTKIDCFCPLSVGELVLSESYTSLSKARLSLSGLALGDAFGTRCYTGPHNAENYPGDERVLLVPGPWRWTDDTAMALSVIEQLQESGTVEPSELMKRFVRRYMEDPQRGYGSGARKLLEQVARGLPYDKAAAALFGGKGSFGNGAAMRVAPLGAWFSEDLDRVVDEAIRSAICTHTHVDGQAGAVAIALAAAIVWEERLLSPSQIRERLFAELKARVPDSPTRDGIVQVASLPVDLSIEGWLKALDTKLGATSAETVPFCIAMISRHLGSLGEGLWRTMAGGGDHDTTAAMVGGVLALYVGQDGIPERWLSRVEPFSRP